MATTSARHPVESPRTGWSEQSPDQWYDATVEAIRRLLTEHEIDPEIARMASAPDPALPPAALDPEAAWHETESADEGEEGAEAEAAAQLVEDAVDPV